MNIQIKATNIKLTPPIEDYVLNKINSLNRFIDGLAKKGVIGATVEVGKTTQHHQKGNFFRAEANMSFPGEVIRAEAERGDLYQAIDEVKDELLRQIKKYKEKQISVKRKEGREIKEKI